MNKNFLRESEGVNEWHVIERHKRETDSTKSESAHKAIEYYCV